MSVQFFGNFSQNSSWLKFLGYFFLLGKIGFNGKKRFCGFLLNLLSPAEKNGKGKM